MGVDVPEKVQVFLMSMSRQASAQNRPGGHVECGEQRRGAMTLVVVRVAFDLARAHRQKRLGSLQRLNLRLLVDAQHHGMGGRTEIEPHDVADLFDEQRVGRELERFGSVRLQPERAPDSADRVGGQPHLTSHRPAAPVRLASRSRLERMAHHLLDLRIGHLARCSRSRLVEQAIQPPSQKPIAVLLRRRPTDAQRVCDGRVAQPVGRGKHDARSAYSSPYWQTVVAAAAIT